MSDWIVDDIPDLSGKIAVITGANSGLGFQATKYMAINGAKVIMACRSIEKAENAKNKILKEYPKSILEIIKLDLADKKSIEEFVSIFTEKYDRLDILLNNAGLMAIPYLKTNTGFEMQIGVNHFGHFMLTGLLMSALLSTPNSRITLVSSLYHSRISDMDFDDINFENKEYKKWEAYSQSKLANLLFMYELNRKLKNIGSSTITNAAHPGFSATDLQMKGPRMRGSWFNKMIMRIANFLFAQSSKQGVLPLLYATTAKDAKGGKYYGPNGFKELRGKPKEVQSTSFARDPDLAKKLWNYSVDQTGIDFSDLNND